MYNDELFIDVNNLPKPLTKEETYELLNKIKLGDKKSQEKLIYHNIRLIIHRVNVYFKNIYYDKKDLVSIGCVGLIKAVNNFDISKNYEFSTYAAKCIDNEILMFYRKLRRRKNIISLNNLLITDDFDNEKELENMLYVDYNIEEEYLTKEIYEVLRNLIQELPQREKEIIILYFGFNNKRRYSQQELAEKLNIKQPTVSRIISKTLKKLEKELIKLGEIEVYQCNKKKKIN